MSPPKDNEASKMETEIVFVDVETTATRSIKELAVIKVSWTLEEMEIYSTVVRPENLSDVPEKSPNGLTRGVVAVAPLFEEVADTVSDMLAGRIWAGYNIKRFDIPLIKKAFPCIGRPAQEPAGIYDTYEILKKMLGNRTVDHKMETLASYLGLGKQNHRSLDDVRMNLILKRCATVLLLVRHVGRPAPEPAGIYDTYEILKKMLGNRTVDHKMETLASYLGLGKQNHRSLDDVRMNLILKRCATVLLLESSPPQMMPVKSMENSSMVTRSRAIEGSCSEEACRRSPPICPSSNRLVPYQKDVFGKVMERAKGTLHDAHGSRPFIALLRLSRFLLR